MEAGKRRIREALPRVKFRIAAPSEETHPRLMIVAAFLLLLVVGFRVVLGVTHMDDAAWLHNFSPLAAVALCGAIYLPRRLAFFLPLMALLISDLLINARYGVALVTGEMLSRYVALALVAGLGLALREKARAPLVLGAAMFGSVLFYLLTNSASWLTDPAYAKTAAGWVQALTTGVAGVRPTTLEFFRNTLISDLLFSAVFVACMNVRRAGGNAVAPRPQEAARWC